MDNDHSQDTKEWPGTSIDLEKLKESFLLLKQKMCKTHELIQRYNDKLKECECLKTERDALKKETKKMTYNYNTALAKMIKLEHQNAEYKRNNENLSKTVSEYEIKISGDQQLTKQLTCKLKDLEDKHSDKIMELDLEKSCLTEKVKDLEQELKMLRKSGVMKLRKLEKKSNDLENNCSETLGTVTVKKLMQDASVNTDPETCLQAVKKEICEKSTMTDEFYSIKDNPYPIFCAKCETFLNPPPIDKICKVMRNCPPLLDNILSPTKTIFTASNDALGVQCNNEEEKEEMLVTEIGTHDFKAVSENNTLTANNSQSSSTFMIQALERKVNALELKLKKESRKRSTSLKSCCPNVHKYCNNFSRKNTFDVQLYPSIVSELCKTLIDINKESKKRKNPNKYDSRKGGNLRKFISKKAKLKSNKATGKKTANPWSVETILKSAETDSSGEEKRRRKVKRKKSSRMIVNSVNFNETFSNEEHPCPISSDVADNIKVDSDADNSNDKEKNDIDEDIDSCLKKSMDDLEKCNDEQCSLAKEKVLIIGTKNATETYENVIIANDDDDDDEEYRVSAASEVSLQSAKKEVETVNAPCLNVETEYLDICKATSANENKLQSPNLETDVTQCETTNEENCNHLSNEMDDYLCSSCGKLVKRDNYSNACTSAYRTDIDYAYNNDLTNALHEYPAISNSGEIVRSVSKMSRENTVRSDNITHDGEEMIQDFTSLIDDPESTMKSISAYQFEDEGKSVDENRPNQSSDLITSFEKVRNICNLCSNELINDTCPSCGELVKIEEVEEKERIVGSLEREVAINGDGVRELTELKEKESRKWTEKPNGKLKSQSEKATLEVDIPRNKEESEISCTFSKDNRAALHRCEGRNSTSTNVLERNVRESDENDTDASSDLPQTENRENAAEIVQETKRKRGRPPKPKNTDVCMNFVNTVNASKEISLSLPEDSNGKYAAGRAEDIADEEAPVKRKRGRPAKLKTESHRMNLMKKLRLLKKNNSVIETSCPSSQADDDVAAYEPTKKRRIARSAGTIILSSTLPCAEKSPDRKDTRVLDSLRRSCRVTVEKLEMTDVNVSRIAVGDRKKDVPSEDDRSKKTESNEAYANNSKAKNNATTANNAVDESDFSLKICGTTNHFDLKCEERLDLDPMKEVLKLGQNGEPCLSQDGDVSPIVVSSERTNSGASCFSAGTFGNLKDNTVDRIPSMDCTGGEFQGNSSPVQRTHVIPIKRIGLLTQQKSKVSVKRKVDKQKEEEELGQLSESQSRVNSINRIVGGALDKSTLVSSKRDLPIKTPNTNRIVHRDDIGIIPSSSDSSVSPLVDFNELPVGPTTSPKNSDTETIARHDNIIMSAVNCDTDMAMFENADQLVATPMPPDKSDAETVAHSVDVRVIPTSPECAHVDDEAAGEGSGETDGTADVQSPFTLFQKMCGNYRRKYKRKRNRESREQVQEATDAFVRKQLRRILDSSEWSSTVHRDIVAKLSSSCSNRIIAKGIVEAIMDESYNKILDSQYTPPAPPMTKAQQKYLTLLLEFRVSKPEVFHYVEQGILYKLFRLNNTPRWPEMERLIRMYVVMARVQKNREKVRIFCLDALYCFGHAIALVFEVVLTSWPEVLPIRKKNSEIIPKVIVHLLMMQTGKDIVLVKKMLMKCYKYPSAGYSADNLLKEMLEAIESEECNGLDTGLLLLAKHVGVSWTYANIIRDGLLQSIVTKKHPNVYRAFCLLGNLMRAFPLNDPDGIVGKIIEQLIDLLESGEGSAEQQEGVASALISLSRHNPNETIKSVLNWKPLKDLTPRTIKQLEMTFSLQTPEFWNAFIKKHEKAKKKLC